MMKMDQANAEEKDAKDKETPMQVYEKCIKACGFGFFNYWVLGCAFIASIANVSVTGNIAYVLPNAECDLHMSFVEKGWLIVTPFFGMICSGFFGGFLVDTFGRMIFVKLGYIGIVLCCAVGGTSQTFTMLATAKLIEGFIFNGLFCASISYISEIHHKEIRDRILLLNTTFIAISSIIVALIAWAILPHDWNLVLFNGAVVRSWNVFLYVCGLSSLAAFLVYSFMPESPKYLVAHGRYDEALAILKRIYRLNTGKPMETFPYNFDTVTKTGVDVKPQAAESFGEQLKHGLADMRPLFRKPLMLYILLIAFMQFMIMLVYNTMRLWNPQLLTIVENYKVQNNRTDELCIMLDGYMEMKRNLIDNLQDVDTKCIAARSGTETYINSVITGMVCTIPAILGGCLVNAIGKKILLFVGLCICAACAVCFHWSNTSGQIVTLISILVAVCQTSANITQLVTVEIFPTTVRSLALSLIMTSGRIGTLLGNVLFPILLNFGCILPFFIISGMLGLSAFSSLLLPVKKKPKKL